MLYRTPILFFQPSVFLLPLAHNFTTACKPKGRIRTENNCVETRGRCLAAMNHHVKYLCLSNPILFSSFFFHHLDSADESSNLYSQSVAGLFFLWVWIEFFFIDPSKSGYTLHTPTWTKTHSGNTDRDKNFQKANVDWTWTGTVKDSDSFVAV